MRNFFMGLTIGLLGLIVWVIASVLAGVGEAGEELGGEDTPAVIWVLVYLGFAVMVLGPVFFWFVVPIVGWLRRRGGAKAD